MTRLTYFISFLALVIAVISCKDDTSGPNLEARTGQDTTAHIGDTVFLDASQSIGSNYELEWSITSQPGTDTITWSRSDSAFYIPTRNGTVTIRLRIIKRNEFSQDFMTVVVAGAVPLYGNFSADTILGRVSQGNDADYIVSADLTITGSIKVNPGVIIEANDDAGIIVAKGAELIADNVTFVEAQNQWKGIRLMGIRTVISNCLIRNAGSSSFTDETTEAAAVLMTDSAVVSFSGNTIENSVGFGIVVKDQAKFQFDEPTYTFAFSDNIYKNNSTGPMKIPVRVLANINNPDLSSESEDGYIYIYESTYPSSGLTSPAITDYGLPYKITGTLKINQALDILQGAKIYFARTAGLIVKGALNISGTSSAPVLMDGLTATPGSWNGIYVTNGNVLINNASILNAGYRKLEGLDEAAALTLEGNLNIKDSEVSGSAGIGIWLKGQASIQYSSSFTNNILSGNQVTAIRLGFDDVHKVVSDNTITAYSDTTPGVQVRDGKSDFLGTWKNLDAATDYEIVSDVTLKATKSMTIESGAVIRVTRGTLMNINGSLDASSVTFKGKEATAGYWDGIVIGTDGHVTFNGVTIRDGGGRDTDKANVVIQPTAVNVNITNSSITNSAGYGVIIKAGASDFSINEPASNNTLGGVSGGFLDEN